MDASVKIFSEVDLLTADTHDAKTNIDFYVFSFAVLRADVNIVFKLFWWPHVIPSSFLSLHTVTSAYITDRGKDFSQHWCTLTFIWSHYWPDSLQSNIHSFSSFWFLPAIKQKSGTYSPAAMLIFYLMLLVVFQKQNYIKTKSCCEENSSLPFY